MNNRRDFLKKSTMAGILLSGATGISGDLFARDKSKLKPGPESNNSGTIVNSISFITSESPGSLTAKAIQIFLRILAERTGHL